MSLTKALAKFRSYSRADRLLCCEAVVWLGIMRLSILLVPLQRIMRWIGASEGDLKMPQDPIGMETAARIGWAITTVACRTPWRSTCLAQALTGMAMLRRRGLHCVCYLGVARAGAAAGPIIAHAWLCYGELVLTGAAGQERYIRIASFSR